nr:hypothetical protein [Haloferax sp. ATB1]
MARVSTRVDDELVSSDECTTYADYPALTNLSGRQLPATTGHAVL